MEESELETPKDDGTLRYRFDARADAENACAPQVHDAVPGCVVRLGVTGDACVVTVTDVAPDWREVVEIVLTELRSEAAKFPGGTAPRRSQPGFSDAAPGMVPQGHGFPGGGHHRRRGRRRPLRPPAGPGARSATAPGRGLRPAPVGGDAGHVIRPAPASGRRMRHRRPSAAWVR
jgi:hypothetical protein